MPAVYARDLLTAADQRFYRGYIQFLEGVTMTLTDRHVDTPVHADTSHPVDQAYLGLRTLFVVAPIAFGLDKFINLLTDWSQYLAPWIDHLVPGTAQQAMYAVGVIEIVAGIVVVVKPRWGALLVAAWLFGIIVNLLTLSGYYDVALRDFGLLVAALALSFLAAGQGYGLLKRQQS